MTPNSEQRHVMVIDDDQGIVEVIKIILEGQGFKVTVSNGGEQIEKLVNKEKPNLLLLDILMYGKSGQEIVKLLKTKPSTSKIPIVMMSASENTRKIANDVGADGYLEKPFDIDYLLEVVNKKLN